MKDCIKVEELKMYGGTGLIFKCIKGHDLNFDEIHFQWNDLMSKDINMIPYVRPLSNFTELHAVELCKLITKDLRVEFKEVQPVFCQERVAVGCDGDGNIFFTYKSNYNLSCSMEIILKDGIFSNCFITCGSSAPIEKELNHILIINYLASKHYDIFNWLGRGLAKELKSN